MKRKLLILSSFFFVISLMSCNKKDEITTDNLVNLTISTNSGGYVGLYSDQKLVDSINNVDSTKEYSFKKGTEINLKVSKNEGFYLKKLIYNSENIKLESEYFTFNLLDDKNYIDINFSLIETNIDDFTFSFDAENKEATITKYECNNIPTPLIIPEEVNGYKVIGITDTAFDYSLITKIKLSKNIKYIPDGAFKNASNLEYFYTEENDYFSVVDGILYNKNKDNLIFVPINYQNKDLILLDSIKQINDYALYANRGIETITFNKSLNKIGKYSFFNVYNLESIELPSSLKIISEYAFKQNTALKTITFNEGLEEIGNNAFYGCTKIRKLTFPTTLKSIGDDAFYHCDYLSEINFNEGLISIGSRAFSNLSALTKIAFPSTLKSVGSSSFSACAYLKEVDFSNIQDIGNYAFALCSSLNKIELPSTIKNIGFNPFYAILNLNASNFSIKDNNYYLIENGVLFNKDKTKLISYPYGLTNKEYKIPTTVKTLDNQCFALTNNLDKLYIPKSVTKIDEAFYGVTSSIEISYEGTIEEFNKIDKTGSNSYSINEGSYYLKEITCSDGVIKL